MDPYAAMTRGVALVDRSESGKLALTGSEAKTFLNGQVTNEIEAATPRCTPTRARFSTTCACWSSARPPPTC